MQNSRLAIKSAIALSLSMAISSTSLFAASTESSDPLLMPLKTLSNAGVRISSDGIKLIDDKETDATTHNDHHAATHDAPAQKPAAVSESTPDVNAIPDTSADEGIAVISAEDSSDEPADSTQPSETHDQPEVILVSQDEYNAALEEEAKMIRSYSLGYVSASRARALQKADINVNAFLIGISDALEGSSQSSMSMTLLAPNLEQQGSLPDLDQILADEGIDNDSE